MGQDRFALLYEKRYGDRLITAHWKNDLLALVQPLPLTELVLSMLGTSHVHNVTCTYAKTQPEGTFTQKVSDATSWEIPCCHHPREHRFLLQTQSHLVSCACTLHTMPSSPLSVRQPCMFRKSFKIGKTMTGNCLQANIKRISRNKLHTN